MAVTPDSSPDPRQGRPAPTPGHIFGPSAGWPVDDSVPTGHIKIDGALYRLDLVGESVTRVTIQRPVIWYRRALRIVTAAAVVLWAVMLETSGLGSAAALFWFLAPWVLGMFAGALVGKIETARADR